MEGNNLTVQLPLLVEIFVDYGKYEMFKKLNTLYHLALEGGKSIDT